MKTEKEKMLAGELYNALDPELSAARLRARQLIARLNLSATEDSEGRATILRELIPMAGEGLWIEPPFYCDYGGNMIVGKRVFFNFNCVVLDVAPVRIGDHVLFGPAVQIYTATHPLQADIRRAGAEFARPIEIGSDVWVGGGVIFCPGVNVGPGSVIGAGSVVTREIPAGVIAAGNPCRVIRKAV